VTFQEIIFALQQFWASRGCIIEQPYDVEVGAGTMCPATFLRVLGPEPWRVAYVQPSRRAQDGRYGDNPYRLYRHYQYQVLLKPSPDDVQAIYLRSLKQALGFEPKEHDIRYMEDDWESPTLGASGVGWQVWLDGLEITQFTYFQQAGGIELSPVSVELTYGLERIAMAIQGVDHFKGIVWGGDGITYGEIYHMAEGEWSRYNFEAADVEMVKRLFDMHEAEAQRLLAGSPPDGDARRAGASLLPRTPEEEALYERQAALVEQIKLAREAKDTSQLKALFEELEKISLPQPQSDSARPRAEDTLLPNAVTGGCILPAYELVLKCSHSFNLLDARGALSVRERASYIARVRDLARHVARAYLGQREALGYPLLREPAKPSSGPSQP